jgi:hypothetical protein
MVQELQDSGENNDAGRCDAHLASFGFRHWLYDGLVDFRVNGTSF